MSYDLVDSYVLHMYVHVHVVLLLLATSISSTEVLLASST